jgi:hypothetical protein
VRRREGVDARSRAAADMRSAAYIPPAGASPGLLRSTARLRHASISARPAHAGFLGTCRAAPARAQAPACCARVPPPPSADEPLSGVELAAVVLAVPSFPLLAASEAMLVRSGCGLPPGPGGSLGAAEGVAYLVLASVVVWSVVKKVRTGSGLRAGPGGILGAVEGVGFLLAVGGVAAATYVAWRYGGLPNAVPAPGSRCFPVD